MLRSDLDMEKRSKKITLDLYEHGMIRTWYRHKPEGWTLVSGMWSPFYIQLRTLCSYPLILKEIGESMAQLLREDIPEATKIAGIAMAGIPIAVATSLVNGLPAVFTRKTEIRDPSQKVLIEYGEHSSIEGELLENDVVVLIDDVVTKFDTKLQAFNQIRRKVEELGLKSVKYNHVAVVLDREQGAFEEARASDISLHSLIQFKSKGLKWLSSKMAPLESQVIKEYLVDPKRFQGTNARKELAKKACAQRPHIIANGRAICE